MQTEDFEEEAIDLFRKHIEDYCAMRWKNVEPEDRLSEAMLVFCQALRTFPLDNGRFWPQFIRMLHSRMDALNRATPSLRFNRDLPLDKQYQFRVGAGHATLHDFLPGPPCDGTALEVASFLRALTGMQRFITSLLQEGMSEKQVARHTGCTLAELRAIRQELGERFVNCQWIENRP